MLFDLADELVVVGLNVNMLVHEDSVLAGVLGCLVKVDGGVIESWPIW